MRINVKFESIVFGIGNGQNLHLTTLYDFLFCVIFSGSRAVTDICRKLKESSMVKMIIIIMKVFDFEGNIFLTSLCMISLFSCHSGKQGCGRYLSKTQRISNNIKIVLHPSLQAAISFSCCFLYH